jgi:hypothetical protein
MADKDSSDTTGICCGIGCLGIPVACFAILCIYWTAEAIGLNGLWTLGILALGIVCVLGIGVVFQAREERRKQETLESEYEGFLGILPDKADPEDMSVMKESEAHVEYESPKSAVSRLPRR